MSEPIDFTSRSPRFGLPMLFPGQTQKEFFVNEAHALTDVLLHAAVEGFAATPPITPAEGECWIVASNPTGAWAGHDQEVASWQAGSWIFVAPRDGLRALDRSRGQEVFYLGGWRRADKIASPEGGTTVDAEAREAIRQLIAALVTGGFLSAA